MTDSTKPQIALVGSYSDAFVKALQDESFEVEQCDSVPNPTTRTPSLAALALKGEEYTLSESDITLMLPAKTVLIFFRPTLTLLKTLQSATNTSIDIPSLKLAHDLPLLVYMVDGMVNIATNNAPSEAQVLALVQSAPGGDSQVVPGEGDPQHPPGPKGGFPPHSTVRKEGFPPHLPGPKDGSPPHLPGPKDGSPPHLPGPKEGFRLQIAPTDPVEQAVMSIHNAVAEAQSEKAYLSTLDPPIGTVGFKKGTLSGFTTFAITWLAWSPQGVFMDEATNPALIQKYALNWYTDVYSYATGADCRNQTSAGFTDAGGVVYTVVIDRGNLQRSADGASRYWGPHRGYCAYYFVDHNMTTHRAGSSLNMHTYQPQGPDSESEGKVGYKISYEQDMQMLNNNGYSAFTFKAKYMNSFLLDQFQLHEILGKSGVEFSVDYNGYYNRWTDPKFATKQWWDPGVYEKVNRDGWEHWVVQEGLPVDNIPVNALTVFSSSVGKHTMTSKFSADFRAFKSNCWRTSSDSRDDVTSSDGHELTRFQTSGATWQSDGSSWVRTLDLTWT